VDDVFDGGLFDRVTSLRCFFRSRVRGFRWRECGRAPLDGGAITATINFIEHYGRVRGAAFPSAHVAGFDCGALGRVEVPAVVVLGDGAAGVSDVRFHDLGKVSLHRGYFWRDCYRDGGYVIGELGDGGEGGR